MEVVKSSLYLHYRFDFYTAMTTVKSAIILTFILVIIKQKVSDVVTFIKDV